MGVNDVDRRVRIHAALADPVRLGIVDELASSDRSPAELAERFGVRSNLLAHHIDVLAAAGLVERLVSRGDRRRRYVRLKADGLAPLVTAPVRRAAGVVFVCTGNAARSPLAAAVWNERSPVAATSAGIHPAERVHPGAVRAARRHRLDLGDATPTHLDPADLDGRLVVTVCDRAHEDLARDGGRSDRPALAAVRGPVLHWSIPDPADGGSARDFDDVVDTLRRRVDALALSVQPS